MTIQFITDDLAVQTGFRAYFHRITVNPNCSEWLNSTSLILTSPEYPNIDCTWIITASIGSPAVQEFGIKTKYNTKYNMYINFQFEVKITWNFFDKNYSIQISFM